MNKCSVDKLKQIQEVLSKPGLKSTIAANPELAVMVTNTIAMVESIPVRKKADKKPTQQTPADVLVDRLIAKEDTSKDYLIAQKEWATNELTVDASKKYKAMIQSILDRANEGLELAKTGTDMTTFVDTFKKDIKDVEKVRTELLQKVFKDELGDSSYNIWFGTGENSELSNLALRPFTYKGKKFHSVEHAYQSLKSGTGLNREIYNDKRWSKEGTKVAKGKTKTENNWNIDVLMKTLMKESFQQNPEAAKDLLDTGSAKLTHTQDKGVWAKEFPRLLTELRTELASGKEVTSNKNILKQIEDVNKGKPAAKHTPKELKKAKIATQYIGLGSTNSSTARYAKVYGDKANTGNYTKDDVVWVSSNGKRNNRVDPLGKGGIKELLDSAIAVGATIVMDTKSHIEKTKYYNIGEVALARYMSNNGYIRNDSSGAGIWTKQNTITINDIVINYNSVPAGTISNMASTDTKTGVITIQKGITSDKVIKYLNTPDSDGKHTKKVRGEVRDIINNNYGIDFNKVIENMDDQDLRKFLLLHEYRQTQQAKKHGNEFITKYKKDPTKYELDADVFALSKLGVIAKSSPIDTKAEISNKTPSAKLPKDYDKFTEGQKQAYKDIVEFVDDPSRDQHILIGAGGTGKTYVIGKVAEMVRDKFQGGVVYAAPTHAAKNQLNLANPKANALTTHKLLGAVPSEEEGIDKGLERVMEGGIPRYSLVIVDEGSMLGENMYNEIMVEAYKQEAKVIFMGDSAQLPPVRTDKDHERIAPHFKNLHSSQKSTMRKINEDKASQAITPTGSVKLSELTETKRFDASSKVGKLINILREATKKNARVEDAFDGKDYSDDKNTLEYYNALDEVLDSFIEEYKNDPVNTRIVTFNNEAQTASNSKRDSVYKLNKQIRAIVNPDNQGTFVEEDKLLAYENLLVDKLSDDANIGKSSTYNVDEVIKTPYVGTEYLTDYKGAVIYDNGNPVKVELEFQEIKVTNVDNPKNVVELKVLTLEGQRKLKELISKFQKDHKENYTKFKFMKTKSAEKLKLKYGNFQYNYSSNAHKTQGQTLKNTYVMYDNIMSSKTNGGSSLSKAKALYTAVSRTSNKLVIIGDTSNMNTQQIPQIQTSQSTDSIVAIEGPTIDTLIDYETETLTDFGDYNHVPLVDMEVDYSNIDRKSVV